MCAAVVEILTQARLEILKRVSGRTCQFSIFYRFIYIRKYTPTVLKENAARHSIERCKIYTESLILAQNERWRRG